MNKQNTLAAFAAIVLVLGAALASASSHESSGPSFRPLEILGCTYNDDKGRSDLMRATERWNNWMDKEQRNDYWAYTLTPIFRSAQLPYDVLWVGGWQDGATMADSMNHWIGRGGDLAEEFARVASCDTHISFAVYDLKREDIPDPGGLVEFSNCKAKKNRSVGDTIGAGTEWIKYLNEHGVGGGHYLLFPAWGETSDADYDFKWVSSYSFDAFGKFFDHFGTGGGWRKSEELFDSIMDCDSGRVYHAAPVRGINAD